MRLITFNGPRVSATPLYADLELLKFLIKSKLWTYCMFINILMGISHVIPLPLLNLKKTNHSIGTRGNAVGLINRSNVRSTNFGLFGLHSFTRLSSNQWNELQQNFKNLNLSELNLERLKSLSTNFYLNKYTE